ARSMTFLPPLISASIDLLVNHARRGELGLAEKLDRDIGASLQRGSAWHAWLWNLRIAEARAELALARGDAETATVLADAALRQAHGRRPKYEALGLGTRAAASISLGRRAPAVRDLRSAVQVARIVGDPALFLRSAAALLAVDGDDALLREARTTAETILSHLPTAEMRKRFQSADT